MRSPLWKSEDRYNNDPAYRTLVDYMVHMIHQLQFTPSELRDAAMFAAIRFEQRNTRPIYVDRESGEFRWDGQNGEPIDE